MSKIIHVGIIKNKVQVIFQGEGLATRIHLYNNTGKGQDWAFTVGTPGNSLSADQVLGFNVGINYGNADGRNKPMISNTVTNN